ncbi:MAG: hypothetical protein EU530_07790 [Promethearchaeota archaeon]|nr:MAG: hypothetical protein EU530_07790 [Candidatus Lokiarchaeota archaeon]
MIAQRYRTHSKRECPAINQCVTTAKTNDNLFIVTGDIEHNVTLYNEYLEKVQEIPFKGWIRCCEVYDIDNNGNHEIAIGSGDNSVRVFRYDEDTGYSELWRYDFDNKVTTLSIGDINYDGRAEVIAGGWDNSLKVFDGLTGVLLWELDFDDWVTLAKVLDCNHDGLPEVVVGLKKGQLGVINGITGECLWDHQFEKRINSCDLVHLANNEFPHLLVGGDDSTLFIFDFDGNLVNTLETPDRILCISHGDINNDNYNEVLVTLADKRLYVYESEDNGLPENTSLKLRWRATLGNVGTGLTISKHFQDNIPRIIVTGYSKDLRILEDNFYGSDRHMESSRHLAPKLSNHEEKLRELLGPDVDLEFYDNSEAFFFPKKIDNINQLIPSNFKSKSESFTFMNLKEAYENKYLLDLQMDQIYQNSLISPKPMVMFPTHISNLSQISEYADQISVSTGIKKPSRAKASPKPKAKTVSSIATSSAIGNREKFIELVQKTGIISSKAKMQELIEQNGFTSAEFDETFKLLKDKEGILTYSKSTPRGYSIESVETVIIDTEIPLQSEGTITVVSKTPIVKEVPQPALEPADLSIPNEKFLNLVKENQPVSSKAKLLDLAESIDIDKKSAEALIDQLKELNVLIYSKSAPRGWSAK